MKNITITSQDSRADLQRFAEHEERTDQDVASDIKYQDITYTMQNGSKSVKDAQIDLFKAINEMKDLNWSSENFIIFCNHRTNKCVQFIRSKEDYWYAEEIIGAGVGWDGYVWGTHSNSKSVLEVVRQFFEEESWEQTLAWKLNRIRGHYTR